MDISFIVPTCRPYQLYAGHVVNSIIESMKDENYKYQILICSKNNPYDPQTIWIKEEGNTLVEAYNQLYKASSGRYIYMLNDKWKTNKKILKAIPFLESDIFKDRKYKVTSINVYAQEHNYEITDMPILNGCAAVQSKLPTELLHPRFLEPQYRYAIFGFPVFERDTVEKYLGGYILNPRFKTHYHDNWLSFYIGEQGEFPLICNDTYMEIFGGGSLCQDDSYDFNIFCELAKDLINKKNSNYV